MTWLQIIFIIDAVVTLFAAVMTVTSRKVVHAALWLILSLLGVAVTFTLLDAGFFAIVQVMVYIGAIAILILFAVMLTHDAIDDTYSKSKKWIVRALVSLITITGIMLALFTWPNVHFFSEPLATGTLDIAAMGEALVATEGYVLPFEISSFLLLAALIGSVYIAMQRKGDQK